MRKSKFIFFLLLSLFLVFLFGSEIRVSADIGPKPSVTVEIYGLEGIKYTATLAARNPTGPYLTYEEWLEYGDQEYLKFHPIMEYKDAEGYMWVGRHWELEGNSEFSWNYYPPVEFKIVVLTEDGKIYSSQVLRRYAFNTYFSIDFSQAAKVETGPFVADAEKTYRYGKEILSFFFRLIATLIIEITFLFFLGYRKRRSYYLVLIVNAVTQVSLNLILNLADYYQGILVGMILFVFSEVLVTVAETLLYGFLLKEKEVWRAVLYGILANLLSFGIGLMLYLFI